MTAGLGVCDCSIHPKSLEPYTNADLRDKLDQGVWMSSTTPSKRRQTTRLLTSAIAKVSVTVLNALGPILLLRLSWNGLLKDPIEALTIPLLPSLFIIQTTFTVLLLPFHVPISKTTKKRNIVKVDTLGDSIMSKAFVFQPVVTDLILASGPVNLPPNPSKPSILPHHSPLRGTTNDAYITDSADLLAYSPSHHIPALDLDHTDNRESATPSHLGIRNGR